MPTQGKSICTYPGCNTLVLKGRCVRHPYPRRNEARRSHRRSYSKAWSEIRAEALRRAPLCEYRVKCNGAPATEVDHVDNNRRNNLADNLVASCKPCHSHKTATQDMRRGAGGRFSRAHTDAGQGEGGHNL